jgi:NADH-quinone oxidoreductase subunit C
MNERELHGRLASAGIAGVGALDESARDPFVVVATDAIAEVLGFLRDDPSCRMEMLHNLTAVERPECMELVYHLCSLAHHHSLTLKLRCARPAGGNHDKWIPEVPSVAGVYAAANWHEREQWDLLGVSFTGHPDLRRILLPEEWKGHPLRKDYVYPTDHGEIPLELDAVPMYEREGAPPRAPRPPRAAGTPLEQPPAPFSSRPLASGGRTVEPGADKGAEKTADKPAGDGGAA